MVALYERTGQMRASQVAGQQADFLSQLPSELLSVTSFIYENKIYKAERLCREFLLEHKHHVEAMRLLAEIGVRLNVYDDAEFLLESCVEFAPDYVRARIDYLNVLIRKTKFEKAHEQGRILLREQPENPAFQISFATTLVGLGRFEQGIAVYQQVLAGAPDQHEVQLCSAMRRRPWVLLLMRSDPIRRPTQSSRISATRFGVWRIPRHMNSKIAKSRI